MQIKIEKGYISVISSSVVYCVAFFGGSPKLARAMAFYPFIIFRSEEEKVPWVINHERIHFHQQLETLFIGSLVLSILETLYARLILRKSSFETYKWLSSEQEAYRNQQNQEYLKGRKMWARLKYVTNKKEFTFGSPGEIIFTSYTMEEMKVSPLKVVVVLLLLAVIVIGDVLLKQEIQAQPQISSGLAALIAAQEAQSPTLDARAQASDCQINAALPDHLCTPGAVFANATPEIICVSGYSKSVRNVSVALKKRVYAEYGIAYPQPTGSYEADHLIPLELGGSNDIANLFPEEAQPVPGFHEKDLVENYLHAKMCAGEIGLAVAQTLIANNWLSVYQQLTPQEIAALKAQAASYPGN